MDTSYIIDTSHLANKSNQVIYDMLRKKMNFQSIINFHENNHKTINSATLSFHEVMGFSILPFSHIEQVDYIPNDIRQYLKSSTMYACESDIVSKIIQTMKPLIQISMPNHIEWLHNNRMNLFYWLVSSGDINFSKNECKQIQNWLEKDNFKIILNNKRQWQSLFQTKLHERKMQIAMMFDGRHNYQDAIDKLIVRRVLAELHEYFKLPIWFELIAHNTHNSNNDLIFNDLLLAVGNWELNYVRLTQNIVQLFTTLTYVVFERNQSQSKHLHHAWIELKERHQEVANFIDAYMKHKSFNEKNVNSYKLAWQAWFDKGGFDNNDIKQCFTDFLNGKPLEQIFETHKTEQQSTKQDGEVMNNHNISNENLIDSSTTDTNFEFIDFVRPTMCQRNEPSLNMNNLLHEIGNHLCELFPEMEIKVNHDEKQHELGCVERLNKATQNWLNDSMLQSKSELKENQHFQLEVLHSMMCDIVDDLRWIKAFLKRKPNLSYTNDVLCQDEATWQMLHQYITTWANMWRTSFGFRSDAEEQELQRIADEVKAQQEAELLKEKQRITEQEKEAMMKNSLDNQINEFKEKRQRALSAYNEINLLGLDVVKNNIKMSCGHNAYHDIQLNIVGNEAAWRETNKKYNHNQPYDEIRSPITKQFIEHAINLLTKQVNKYSVLADLLRQPFETNNPNEEGKIFLTPSREREIKHATINGISIFALLKEQSITIQNFVFIYNQIRNVHGDLSYCETEMKKLNNHINSLQEAFHQQLEFYHSS